MATNGKTIFIADDDENLRSVLVSHFTEAGFTVFESADGEDVLKRVLTEQPDMVLSDILMPNMNGGYVLERIRESEWGKDAKVIMMSSLDRDDLKEKAERLGAVAYIVKQDTSPQEIVELAKNSL